MTTAQHRSPRSPLATARDWRLARARRARLERELATYATTAEVSDLLATVQAQDVDGRISRDPEADVVRSILVGRLQLAS